MGWTDGLMDFHRSLLASTPPKEINHPKKLEGGGQNPRGQTLGPAPCFFSPCALAWKSRIGSSRPRWPAMGF